MENEITLAARYNHNSIEVFTYLSNNGYNGKRRLENYYDIIEHVTGLECYKIKKRSIRRFRINKIYCFLELSNITVPVSDKYYKKLLKCKTQKSADKYMIKMIKYILKQYNKFENLFEKYNKLKFETNVTEKKN